MDEQELINLIRGTANNSTVNERPVSKDPVLEAVRKALTQTPPPAISGDAGLIIPQDANSAVAGRPQGDGNFFSKMVSGLVDNTSNGLNSYVNSLAMNPNSSVVKNLSTSNSALGQFLGGFLDQQVSETTQGQNQAFANQLASARTVGDVQKLLPLANNKEQREAAQRAIENIREFAKRGLEERKVSAQEIKTQADIINQAVQRQQQERGLDINSLQADVAQRREERQSRREGLPSGYKINPRTGEAELIAGINPQDIRQGSVVNVNTKAETAKEIERAKSQEQRRNKFLEESFGATGQAPEQLQSAINLKTSLDSLVANNAQTSPVASAVSLLRTSANALGVPIDLSPDATLQQIESEANKLSIPIVKQLGVNPTDRDLKTVQSTVPNVGKTMAGNYALVDLQAQIAKRNLELERVLDQMELEGADIVELRTARRDFLSKNPLVQPQIIKDVSGVSVGDRIARNDGIYQVVERDGKKGVIKVSY